MSVTIRAVIDHAAQEIAELDGEIAKLTEKVAALGRKRATIAGMALLCAEHQEAEGAANGATKEA